MAHYPPSSVAGEVTTPNRDYAGLTYDVLDEGGAIRAVRDGGAGATVLFSGTTRDNFQGDEVTRLEYEAYTSLALKTLRVLMEQAHVEHAGDITRIYIAHRLGPVPVGETSIVIAVSSPHRKPAFVVAEWLLEETKKSVAIWKREFYASGRAIFAPDGQSQPESEASAWKANFP